MAGLSFISKGGKGIGDTVADLRETGPLLGMSDGDTLFIRALDTGPTRFPEPIVNLGL
jgi:hypothetical protein